MKKREFLTNITNEIKPEGMGVIVRTAAAEASKEQLKNDIEF